MKMNKVRKMHPTSHLPLKQVTTWIDRRRLAISEPNGANDKYKAYDVVRKESQNHQMDVPRTKRTGAGAVAAANKVVVATVDVCEMNVFRSQLTSIGNVQKESTTDTQRNRSTGINGAHLLQCRCSGVMIILYRSLHEQPCQ
jgi:hypothetical protein